MSKNATALKSTTTARPAATEATKAKLLPRAGSRAAAKAQDELAEQKRQAKNAYTRAWRAKNKAAATTTPRAAKAASKAPTEAKVEAFETSEAPDVAPTIAPGRAVITKAQLIAALEVHVASERAKGTLNVPRIEALQVAVDLARLLKA